MPKELIPYSIFLLVFICVNMGIYFVIHLKAKEMIFRELFYYWFSVLLIVISEGIVTTGKLQLSLVFLVNFIPIAIMSNFILRSFKYKFQWKFYAYAIPSAVLLTLIFNFFDAPFVVTSMPIVLIASMPFFIGFYTFARHRKDAGQIETIIAIFVFSLGVFCCMNYAFNRYNPTQMQFLFGYGSAFVCYLLYSILLPIYCIQQINRKRTEFLEELVANRTKELMESKHEKEKLIRVLVHDISNPLQAAIYKVGQIKKSAMMDNADKDRIEKMSKNLDAITEIITHVREYECVLAGTRTMDLEDVKLSECLENIEQLFSDRFREKNVKLLIHNKLPDDELIRVNPVSFVHSVASNLISNALKFSRPDSVVLVECSKQDSNIVIKVIDNGIGMSKDNLATVFDIGASTSRYGTLGESGTGFGLPIVKAYTTMFGGRIEAVSSQDEESSGTTFTLTLPAVNTNYEQNNQTFIQ